MLNKILQNLKKYPDDECYQIKDKIYKNKNLYKYICNIYNYLLINNKKRKFVFSMSLPPSIRIFMPSPLRTSIPSP